MQLSSASETTQSLQAITLQISPRSSLIQLPCPFTSLTTDASILLYHPMITLKKAPRCIARPNPNPTANLLAFALTKRAKTTRQQIDLHNITVIMLESPNLTVSKSIFYRGISLREYLQKQADSRYTASFVDDSTIFDEMTETVTFQPAFQMTNGSALRQARLRLPESKSMNFEALSNPKSNRYLPTIHLAKNQKPNAKNQTTERNSTDTSLGNEAELNCVALPNIKRRGIIRERNITMASRSSSRSVSCRKKFSSVLMEVQEHSQETSPRGKNEVRGISLEMRLKDMEGKQSIKLRAYSQIKNAKVKSFGHGGF